MLWLALAGGASLAYARTNVASRGLLPTPAAVAVSPMVNATLAFDPSPSPEVAGYRLYWGVRSGSYTNAVRIGNQTMVIASNLVRGVKYYFAATAYDTNGLESPFSNEAVFPAPMTNYASVFVESSGSATGQWTNFWQLTLTNPPGSSQFFRFGIRETNSGSVVRLDARTLKITNTNSP